MTEVKFFDPSFKPDIKLTYAVIAAKYGGTGFLYVIRKGIPGKFRAGISKKKKLPMRLPGGNLWKRQVPLISA